MKLIVGVFTCFFLTACSTPLVLKRTGYVWPPAPDIARIEWVGAYTSQHDFPKTVLEEIAEKIGGKQPPIFFAKPWGIATDGEKIYVADTQKGVVLLYDLDARKVITIGAGTLKTPMGVVVDAKGQIYVSDPSQARIFIFSQDGKLINTLGGEGFAWPVGMALDEAKGQLYIADSKAHQIVALDIETNSIIRSFGASELNYPTDVALDPQGNLVVADSMNARVQIFNSEGKLLKSIGQRGDGPCDLQSPKGVAVDQVTGNIYISDSRNDRFTIFSADGSCLSSVGASHSVDFRQAAGGFNVPQDITIDKKGRIYVVDSLNRRFQVFQIVDPEWLQMKNSKAEGRI